MNLATFILSSTQLSFNYGKIHISAKTVKYIESVDGNYSILKFVNRQQIVSSYTLNHYSEMLECTGNFFNIRKGVLINLNFLGEIEKRSDGFYALMRDGSHFRMSRRKGRDLIKFLENSLSTKTFLPKTCPLRPTA